MMAWQIKMLSNHFQLLVNFLYRNPRSRLKMYNRFGGYINYRKMMAGRRLMERQSAVLPPVISHTDGLPVYFLTGKKYLYQTLYCITSLTAATSQKFNFILVDDGSFDDSLIKRTSRQLPGVQIITRQQIDHNLQLLLPESHYPVLHQKRQVYPHIKKLTDVHTIPGSNWKLVLDSDMLFWDTPQAIIAWLKDAQKPLHMVDCAEAYGYSIPLMQQLAGTAIKPLLNVGAIGLNSRAINWPKVEHWVATLEQQEGTSYYLEQALSAMIIGNDDAVALPAASYIVNPDKTAITTTRGVLHHYVDLSKEGYFKTAWKHFL